MTDMRTKIIIALAVIGIGVGAWAINAQQADGEQDQYEQQLDQFGG